MLLAEELWDKPVIDLQARRVVRVNDAIITCSSPNLDWHCNTIWWVQGVDVALSGVLRRLRLDWLARRITKPTTASTSVRWQHLDVSGSETLGRFFASHSKLAHLHPVDIAHITGALSHHQGAEIIASLDDPLAANALDMMIDAQRSEIVQDMPQSRAAHILSKMAPDEAADLLTYLPRDKTEALLHEMSEEEALEFRWLMHYPEHTAGASMTTRFVRVLPHMTVSQVIEANRAVLSSPSADLIYYMYVVSSAEDRKLVGVITLRDLLIRAENEIVGDFMLREFVSVGPDDSDRDIAYKIAEYNLLALPVTSEAGALLGIVTIDDVLKILVPEGWKKRFPTVFS